MHTTIQAPSFNPRYGMKRSGACSVFFQKKGVIFAEEEFSALQISTVQCSACPMHPATMWFPTRGLRALTLPLKTRHSSLCEKPCRIVEAYENQFSWVFRTCSWTTQPLSFPSSQEPTCLVGCLPRRYNAPWSIRGHRVS